MPRKRSSYAEAKAQKAQEASWKYLVRNPAFMKDLTRLHKSYLRYQRKPKPEYVYDAHAEMQWLRWKRRVCDKYGIRYIPSGIVPHLLNMDLAALESWGADPDISYTPVSLGQLKENRFLFFRVDLDHPVDDLLPLIEEQLRNFYRDRPKRRRRVDKVDFNCKVYDLAKEGKKFSEIAATLNKRLSTVKSAYLTASRHIFLLSEPPTKKELPLIDFDPHRHCQSCAICQKAQTFDSMCEKSRLFADRDSKAQRATLGHDTSGESYAKRRNDDY